MASEEDLAGARYDSLTAQEIVSKLPELSQIELAKIFSYERKHDNRTTILSRVSASRGAEPWPGYDELTVHPLVCGWWRVLTSDPTSVREDLRNLAETPVSCTDRWRQAAPASRGP